MKQYVLDEPVPATAPPGAEGEAHSLRQPGRWRWFLLVLLLEPVALGILYVGLSGGPGWSQAATGPTPGSPVAYAPSFSFPRQREAAPTPLEPAPAESRASRIAHERGRYVIDLQEAAPGPALAMLAQATKARVAGADIFIGSPVRLTRSAIAASPREAWQAVFGDVANFAIACAGKACEVRFVSLLKPGSPVPAPDSLQGEFSHTEVATAPAMAPPAQAPVGQAAAAALSTQNGDPAGSEN